MAFRSHWRFAAEFCTPGEGHEKVALKAKVVTTGATTWLRCSVLPISVDSQGCVTVKTNFYSVPVRAGTRVEVRIHPRHVGILACRSSDCPPRTLQQPSPACSRSRALPRCAELQAGRVGRIEATVQWREAIVGLPAATSCGSAADAARQAERLPRHGGGAGVGPGVWPWAAAGGGRLDRVAWRLRRSHDAISADRSILAQATARSD